MNKNYLCVDLSGEDEVVSNIISIDDQDSETLATEAGLHDYLLEQDLYSPAPQIGWLYDVGNDSFSEPAEDFAQELTDKVSALAQALTDVVNARNEVELEAISDAVDAGDTSMVPSETASVLWPMVAFFIKNSEEN